MSEQMATLDAKAAREQTRPPAGFSKPSEDAGSYANMDMSELLTARRKAFGAAKRLLDIVASLLLLILLAPLLLAAAAAIIIDSKGPVFYRQRRVGADGKIFEIYKFRSMQVDAENSGPRWAALNDERVTVVGRFLRKTRLDEVPQVLNVLRGEMSFVGPRPERPEFVATLEREIPEYHMRHVVKPGITGWAQVRHAYAASIEDARVKQMFDLEYIRNYALRRDLLIIVLTVKVVLFGLGSR